METSLLQARTRAELAKALVASERALDFTDDPQQIAAIKSVIGTLHLAISML